MYRNNNLLSGLSDDPRGGTVLDGCIIPPTTWNEDNQYGRPDIPINTSMVYCTKCNNGSPVMTQIGSGTPCSSLGQGWIEAGHNVDPCSMSFSCPEPWGDPYNGIYGNFCNWKQTFKGNFLTRQRPCNFLNIRRQVHQDQLTILQTNGTSLPWQELLQHKLGYIQYLGSAYFGCYTNSGSSARVSSTPRASQRRGQTMRRRTTNMKNINRNIYNI